jgi:mono/diheme cytochrome c family protein
VLIAITNEGKVGLGVLAGLLIVFAILSAFYFPRRNPDFPGDRLGLFTLVTVILFVATMAGVVVFAKEEEGAHGAEAAETHSTETGEEPATTGGATTEQEPGGAAGDPAAGESVYASAGCGACHALEAAGSSGQVGPDLDESKPDAELVVDRVTNGKGAMPPFKGQLDEKQIQDVAAFVVESTR